MTSRELDAKRLMEAVIFAAAEPVPEADLAARLPDDLMLAPLLQALAADYDKRGVQLVKRGDGWAFRTAPDLAAALTLEKAVVRRLSRVAMETLAIIAYNQPIPRAEIESVRGVATARGTLDALVETGWIKPGGRRETPGRPLTWVTTADFLDHFGLSDLAALPNVEELKASGFLDVRPAIEALPDTERLPLDEPEEDTEATPGLFADDPEEGG